MLVTLGLDPADYKAERVNLALHVRAKRPAPVVAASTLAERMDAACVATGEALVADIT